MKTKKGPMLPKSIIKKSNNTLPLTDREKEIMKYFIKVYIVSILVVITWYLPVCAYCESFPKIEKREIVRVVKAKKQIISKSMTPEEQFNYDYENDINFKNYIDTMDVKRNNPGNLEFRNQPTSWKDPNSGFAVFPTPYAGFRALIMQITLDAKRGDTIRTFIEDYAPEKDNNDTEGYIDFIAYHVAHEDTLLTDLDPVWLAVNITRKEHSVKY